MTCSRRPLAGLLAACVLLAAVADWGGVGSLVYGAEDRAVSAAIQGGVNALKREFAKDGGLAQGESSLAALALLKAGEPMDGPEISAAIERVRAKIREGTYHPTRGQYQVYEAGVDLMLLADGDPDRYHQELEVIAQYIVSQQGEDGSWDYPTRDVGDTSITQYAMLGLWAAARAGLDIDPAVWDNAARWHLKTQLQDGGYAYHPGKSDGLGGGASTTNMTAGGTGNLLIARLYLYPNARPSGQRARGESESGDRGRVGVLEKVDVGTVEPPQGRARRREDFTPQATLNALQAGIDRGLGWVTARFRPLPQFPGGHEMYYYYTMERLVALANITERGGRDWYGECLVEILKKQTEDGSWARETYSGSVVATSFAVLFLTKSTAKLLGRPTAPGVGGGLLAGGRGLPTDLSQVDVRDGKVQARKVDASLEELLSALENPQSLNIEAAQAAIVETVQVGDREALIGEQQRLMKLVDDSRAEVRRTALWALARGNDLRVAPLMIRALEDPDLDVVVEAHNALCYLSRTPRAFGLAASPLDGLAEDASEADREQAVAKWRQEAVAKWREWHLRIRPYDERDDLIESRLQRR